MVGSWQLFFFVAVFRTDPPFEHCCCVVSFAAWRLEVRCLGEKLLKTRSQLLWLGAAQQLPFVFGQVRLNVFDSAYLMLSEDSNKRHSFSSSFSLLP
jgi:hypothetical protein